MSRGETHFNDVWKWISFLLFFCLLYKKKNLFSFSLWFPAVLYTHTAQNKRAQSRIYLVSIHTHAWNNSRMNCVVRFRVTTLDLSGRTDGLENYYKAPRAYHEPDGRNEEKRMILKNTSDPYNDLFLYKTKSTRLCWFLRTARQGNDQTRFRAAAHSADREWA